MPFVLVLPLVGYGWAHWDRALDVTNPAGLGWVLAAWSLLHAGAMWLNAALDHDQGEVLLGRSVPVPAGTAVSGYVALALAVALGLVADLLPGICAALCTLLAILYSHPLTVGKGRPLIGPLVNWLGYGLLSPLAGWGLVSQRPDARTMLAWGFGSLVVLGCYFAAQAFQGPEDARRGYRTLVVTHGPRGALLAARLCIGAGFLGGVILAALGWLPRVCLVAFPLGFWVDRWLRRWANQADGGDARWARGLALRLLLAAAVGIGLAYADYWWDLSAERLPAGLGTVAGHPPD